MGSRGHWAHWSSGNEAVLVRKEKIDTRWQVMW